MIKLTHTAAGQPVLVVPADEAGGLSHALCVARPIGSADAPDGLLVVVAGEVSKAGEAHVAVEER